MSDPSVPDPTSSEPALAVGAVTAFVTAVIGLLVAFGLPVTDDQQAAILGITAVLAPVIAGWFIRSRVFSPAAVARLLDRHHN